MSPRVQEVYTGAPPRPTPAGRRRSITLSVSPSPATVGSTVSVSGYVYDEDRPAPNADVRITVDGVSGSVRTNSSGYYSWSFTAPSTPRSVTVTAASGAASRSTTLSVVARVTRRSLTVSASPSRARLGERVRIIGRLAEDGTPVPRAGVTVNIADALTRTVVYSVTVPTEPDGTFSHEYETRRAGEFLVEVFHGDAKASTRLLVSTIPATVTPPAVPQIAGRPIPTTQTRLAEPEYSRLRTYEAPYRTTSERVSEAVRPSPSAVAESVRGSGDFSVEVSLEKTYSYDDPYPRMHYHPSKAFRVKAWVTGTPKGSMKYRLFLNGVKIDESALIPHGPVYFTIGDGRLNLGTNTIEVEGEDTATGVKKRASTTVTVNTHPGLRGQITGEFPDRMVVSWNRTIGPYHLAISWVSEYPNAGKIFEGYVSETSKSFSVPPDAARTLRQLGGSIYATINDPWTSTTAWYRITAPPGPPPAAPAAPPPRTPPPEPTKTTEAKSEIPALEKEKRDLVSRVSRARSELADLEGRIRSALDRIPGLESTVARLRQTVADLESRLSSLRAQVGTIPQLSEWQLREQIEALKSELRSLTTEYTQLLSERDRLRAMLGVAR